MPNFIIFGAPGSGKGTQSALLIDKYNLKHISTGQLLRNHIAQHTKLGQIADGFISNGQLIPDKLMLEILADEIDNNHDLNQGLILDGFPRTLPQAEELNKMLAERDQKIDAVIGLEVPEEELIDRLIKRGEASGRSDDSLEIINKRMDVYRNQTLPLKDFYQREGKYRQIEATGAIEEIFDKIDKAINS